MAESRGSPYLAVSESESLRDPSRQSPERCIDSRPYDLQRERPLRIFGGVAEQIIDQRANYVPALKGNQSTFAAEVEEAFMKADAKDYRAVESNVLETK
jgi:hypothetical protein